MLSILDGVNKIIDQGLGLKHIGLDPQYQHKEHCQKLTKSPDKFDAKSLIKAIYGKVERNWNGGGNPSPENWHLIKNFAKEDEAKNENRMKKLEVRLEREIVCPKDNDWFNQVPVASGLMNDRSDKRRAIDLVHRCADGVYEFVELKVDSGTPLYAAMEILQYGILYILARRNPRIKDAAKEKRLLEAATIHLKVLAPCDYYKGCKLDWLEDEMCRGLKGFLSEQKVNLQMDFRFEAFPPGFILDPFPEDDAIVQALRERRAVFL